MTTLTRERDEARARLSVLSAAATELADLMDATRDGDYAPDSFTTQPIRTALAGAKS